ncbi:extracellular solute-binding protein family 1 [Stanieria sp. NIES-3757]|nr:extracellular solute-binding protein family 1 [Stanieria sp. NIES-3757]
MLPFNRWQKRLIFIYLPLVALVSIIIVACSNTSDSNLSQVNQSINTSDTLQIWWDKGYIPEEDEILQKIVNNWQKQTGNQVELTFYTADEITQKTKRAIEAGNPPDVLFASRAEYPLLAWQGKLADVSEVIKPIEKLYSATALKAAYLYNDVANQKSYYAVPLHQATIHIFYWRDWLKKVGKTAQDIPQDWDSFWQFWQPVSDQIKAQEKSEIYALGIPISVEASDTYYLFEQILEAYDVKILDSQGNLLITQPEVRQGIITCLQWYQQLYQQRNIPPQALQWLDPDNNRNLLNRQILMTPNPTLSIASAVRQDPETYFNKLGISEFPHKPSGKPMRHIVSVRQAVILAGAKHEKIAKEFLTYLIQPEVIADYLKSAGGRYVPVMIAARKDKFWQNQADPHIYTAVKTLIDQPTRLFYSVQNPAYSVVLEQNIWGQALKTIIVEGISPEQAADNAIAQIQQIFATWQ